MSSQEHPHPDGMLITGDDPETASVVLCVGPVKLKFTRAQFYSFVTLFLDAEDGFRQYYCEHGRRDGSWEESSGEVEFSSIPCVGRVYECADCQCIHVDAHDQHIVVAPGCFWYFLALLRQCAASLEAQFPLCVASQDTNP